MSRSTLMEWAPSALALLGIGLMVLAAWMWSTPLGVLFVGVCCLGLGMFLVETADAQEAGDGKNDLAAARAQRTRRQA